MLPSKFNAIDFADGAAYGSAPPQKNLTLFHLLFHLLLTTNHGTRHMVKGCEVKYKLTYRQHKKGGRSLTTRQPPCK